MNPHVKEADRFVGGTQAWNEATIARLHSALADRERTIATLLRERDEAREIAKRWHGFAVGAARAWFCVEARIHGLLGVVVDRLGALDGHRIRLILVMLHACCSTTSPCRSASSISGRMQASRALLAISSFRPRKPRATHRSVSRRTARSPSVGFR